MAMVIKGNSLISIPDNRVDDYLARGYDLASEAGTVVKKAVPTDKAELQKLYTEQVAEIANLKNQLAGNNQPKKDDGELEAVKKELAEMQESYDKLVKMYEELEEERDNLQAEVEKLKAPAPKKSTRAKKSE